MARKQELSLIGNAIDLMKRASVQWLMGLRETLRQGMAVIPESEAERTRRADISLKCEEMLADCELRRKALELYLDRSFDGRAEALKQKFIALGRA